MYRRRTQPNNGFTLIEVLVVIAIIALLFSIGVGSYRRVQVNARNVKKVELSRQYINALASYYNENNGYPDYTGDAKCLGTGITSCQGGGLVPNASLNAELDEEISGPPADDGKVMWGEIDMTGITYVCDDGNDSDGVCEEYLLLWYLEGINQECGQATVQLNFPSFGTSVLTQCQYYSQ